MKSPFPQDWKEYTIGDCLRRVEHPVEVDSDALYTQIGIRSHGKGLFYKEPVTGESLGNKTVYWVEPDCFILNIVFAWEQAIGKTTQAEVGMIGSHRFPMYKPVNHLIDIDYLVYYLLTKRGTDILEAASPGGAGRNRTLGQDRFMKSRIVLPPLDEQKKIAEILATQDKAIELQGRKIEELKRFKKGCLEKMFPRKGQKIPEKRFPRFTDDWEQRKLSELTSMHARIGWQNLRTSEFLDSGDYMLITGTDFNDGAINFSTCHYVERERYEQDRNIQIHNGSILITKDGTLGKVAYVQGLSMPATLNAGVFNVQIKDANNVDERYLFQYLKAPFLMDYVDKKATGGTIKHLNQSILVDFPVILPQRSEQILIGAFFQQLDNLITLHQRKLEEMKRQKKALMQLLLTGIVRVQS